MSREGETWPAAIGQEQGGVVTGYCDDNAGGKQVGDEGRRPRGPIEKREREAERRRDALRDRRMADAWLRWYVALVSSEWLSSERPQG